MSNCVYLAEFMHLMHRKSLLSGFWIMIWWFPCWKLRLPNIAKNTHLRKTFEVTQAYPNHVVRGSSNVTWPAWGKNFPKVNNQFLYDCNPMWVASKSKKKREKTHRKTQNYIQNYLEFLPKAQKLDLKVKEIDIKAKKLDLKTQKLD